MDTETRLQALEDKIHRQDKKLRLHKRLGLIAAALLVGAAAFAATRPVAEVIEARKFVLRDAKGNMRGAWGTPGDKTGLVLINSKGVQQIALIDSDDGAALGIHDAKGVGRIGIGTTSHNELGKELPGISFYNAEDKGGLLLAMLPTGPALSLLTTTGELGGFFAWDKDTGPRIQLYGPGQKSFWNTPLNEKK